MLLILFEVGIELYSLGWLDPIPAPPPPPPPEACGTCLAATALQKGEEATLRQEQHRQHGARVSRKHSRQTGPSAGAGGDRHVV